MYLDLKLDLSDEALGLVGLTDKDLTDIKRGRRERANTVTGATGATVATSAKKE